jgi:hypothetical protein
MIKQRDPTYDGVLNAIVTETMHIPLLTAGGLPGDLDGDIFVHQMSQVVIDIGAQIVRVDEFEVLDLAMERVEVV